MERLGFAQIDARARELDRAAASTPAVDAFCSSSAWVLPAQAAFSPGAHPFAAREGDAWVLMMRVPVRTGSWAAVPLEAGWGLAAPLLGPDPTRSAELLWLMCETTTEPLQALFVSGIQRDGPHWAALLKRFGSTHRMGLGEACPRRAASLAGGYEGWLSRRSARFRANLRRAQRAGEAARVTFERHEGGPPDALFDRIVDIESRSWKGVAGEGINDGPPRDFYRRMIRRLSALGALRVVFATRDGADLGYVFGGLMGHTYRGLQVSFDDAHRALSLGNLAQAEMIRWLCEDAFEVYDLGTDMEYKVRWAEPGLGTVTLVLLP
jgi:hypothetical protein